MANHKNLPDEVNNAWRLPGAETWWFSVSEYQGECSTSCHIVSRKTQSRFTV